MPICAAIFDLDATLINTQEIKELLFNFIKEIASVDDETAMTIYKSARSKNDQITFSLESLKREIIRNVENFDKKKWADFVKDFKKPRKGLLIDGAEELLNFFKENKIPVYVLTLGVEEWQKNKMKLSGLSEVLGDDFTNLKYTSNENAKKGKIKEIKEILSELKLENCDDVLFFNDRPDETMDIMKEFSSLRVFIRREKGDKRHTNKDFEELSKNENVIRIADDLNFIDDIKKTFNIYHLSYN